MRYFKLSVLKLFAALALMLSFSAVNAQSVGIQQTHSNTTNITAVAIQAYYLGHLSNRVISYDVYPTFANDNRLHGQLYLKLAPPDSQGNALTVDTSAYSIFGVPTGYSEDNWGCDSSDPNSNCEINLEDFYPGEGSTIAFYLEVYDSSVGQWHADYMNVFWNSPTIHFDWNRVTAWTLATSGPLAGTGIYLPLAGHGRMLY